MKKSSIVGVLQEETLDFSASCRELDMLDSIVLLCSSDIVVERFHGFLSNDLHYFEMRLFVLVGFLLDFSYGNHC